MADIKECIHVSNSYLEVVVVKVSETQSPREAARMAAELLLEWASS